MAISDAQKSGSAVMFGWSPWQARQQKFYELAEDAKKYGQAIPPHDGFQFSPTHNSKHQPLTRNEVLFRKLKKVIHQLSVLNALGPVTGMTSKIKADWMDTLKIALENRHKEGSGIELLKDLAKYAKKTDADDKVITRPIADEIKKEGATIRIHTSLRRNSEGGMDEIV